MPGDVPAGTPAGLLAAAGTPMPAIAPHAMLVFLLAVTSLLAGALLLGRLAQRLGLPAIVGELATGILVGPSVFAQLAPEAAHWLFPPDPNQFHLVEAVGQIGVILFVGMTGTEMDVPAILRRGRAAAQVSLGGLIVPLGLGVATGLLLPAGLLSGDVDDWVFALFLGVAMAVSAIPVIARILVDLGLLHSRVGQMTLAAGTVDDAVGWLLLSVVSALATTGVRTGDVLTSVVSVLGTVVVAGLVGGPVAEVVLRQAGRRRAAGDSPASAVSLACVVMILGAAAATQALRLEAIFGAFIAGMVIGSRRSFDPRLVAPVRLVVTGVLAPLFFATAGLRVDLTQLRRPSVLAAGAVVLAVAVTGKFLGAYLGARASHLGRWEALALGAGMNARGVVEVVVAGTGLRLGVIDSAGYTVVVLVAVATSIMAPPLLRWTVARGALADPHDHPTDATVPPAQRNEGATIPAP
ncbi:Sodium:proton exchanger [Frankia canadensis]|uniref:Sodium:proton exchanger n=1 Tax=Frankia canadensis TaxID=1836972 RepID=A0A2I2KQM4_9ACTN|nr:cation:proton antiporter [Frankia canadensis]SNQ47971.1 Sodium:proton exchanger [Frankia canadensis]SOU55261.1 Sodium:proton exchanger [Frankia canadensis]